MIHPLLPLLSFPIFPTAWGLYIVAACFVYSSILILNAMEHIYHQMDFSLTFMNGLFMLDSYFFKIPYGFGTNGFSKAGLDILPFISLNGSNNLLFPD